MHRVATSGPTRADRSGSKAEGNGPRETAIFDRLAHTGIINTMATTPRSASPSPPLELRLDRKRSASLIQQAPAVATTPTEVLPNGSVGRNEATFYRKLMPAWRCDIREYLVASLEREIDDLVAVQTTWRTRFRDQYFVKTSLLGTHTFFMIFIPIWAWYGFPEVARGLLYVLAAGGYVTSVLKDAFCVPRPFAPPVNRLSVGSHALEYGFPSTHSSNALSMALFFGELLLRRNPGHLVINSIGVLLLVLFAWSITFGRLYTGMHSRMDVRVGASIGVLVWMLMWLGEAKLERLVLGTGLTGTVFIIPALLLLVTFHPQPAENCPCFEDAIAFLSVFAGILLGVAWNPYKYADFTLGHRWRDWTEIGFWSIAVVSKVIVGVSSILVWRIVAKYLCHSALPPLFRLFAPIFSLPRRYYLAATEYGSYPKQTSLNAVPSILDLPRLAEDAEVSNTSTAISSTSSSSTSMRNRPQRSPASEKTPVLNDGTASLPHLRSRPVDREQGLANGQVSGPTEPPIHLDADVLTKVIVYAGIGWIATVTLPWFFGGLGLSVWREPTHLSTWAGRSLLESVAGSAV
ncbi:phosphatase PAP2 family protein [Sporobolomyces koalae]|uniref:phosphatase PAP2 family protein n=1 Tax=Sporobolomyces koalae TaxID=500713 RepID=UPI003173F286